MAEFSGEKKRNKRFKPKSIFTKPRKTSKSNEEEESDLNDGSKSYGDTNEYRSGVNNSTNMSNTGKEFYKREPNTASDDDKSYYYSNPARSGRDRSSYYANPSRSGEGRTSYYANPSDSGQDQSSNYTYPSRQGKDERYSNPSRSGVGETPKSSSNDGKMYYYTEPTDSESRPYSGADWSQTYPPDYDTSQRYPSEYGTGQDLDGQGKDYGIRPGTERRMNGVSPRDNRRRSSSTMVHTGGTPISTSNENLNRTENKSIRPNTTPGSSSEDDRMRFMNAKKQKADKEAKEALDRKRDTPLNSSFERKLSNSIAIPGVHDDKIKNNKTAQSKDSEQKPQSNTQLQKSHPNIASNTDVANKKSKIPVKKEENLNIDETGEKARLISVRRLGTPTPLRKHELVDDSETSSTISDSNEAPDVFLPKRYLLALMMFLGFVNMYAIRVNLNVAIGAMVNNHTVIKDGVAVIEPPEFDWSSRLQGVILGSFYYGYMILQIPGGYFAMKYGGTKIFGSAVLIASALTILTPFATRYSVWALVVLRVLEGLVLGVMLPCNHQIWSLWAPLQERTTLVTLAIAGMNVGTVVTMPLTGLLTKYGFDGGWASVFYCFGVFGLLWSILWFFVAYPSPSAHATITKKERRYIIKNVTTRKSMSVPWKAIFQSRPVWAVIIGNVANDWGLYTILICLPLFLMDIMKFNVQTMGFVASLPFLLKAIVGPIGGVIADVLRYKYTSTANVRRIFYAIGAMSAAVMIVIAGYSQTPTVVVLSMCIGVAISGLLHSGYEVNILDIAPSLSGIVMGITNTAGTTAGFLSPLLVGYMTENKLQSEWITVFWITFLFYAVGTILFCFLLSGEAQHWAVDDDDVDEDYVRHKTP